MFYVCLLIVVAQPTCNYTTQPIINVTTLPPTSTFPFVISQTTGMSSLKTTEPSFVTKILSLTNLASSTAGEINSYQTETSESQFLTTSQLVVSNQLHSVTTVSTELTTNVELLPKPTSASGFASTSVSTTASASTPSSSSLSASKTSGSITQFTSSSASSILPKFSSSSRLSSLTAIVSAIALTSHSTNNATYGSPSQPIFIAISLTSSQATQSPTTSKASVEVTFYIARKLGMLCIVVLTSISSIFIIY